MSIRVKKLNLPSDFLWTFFKINGILYGHSIFVASNQAAVKWSLSYKHLVKREDVFRMKFAYYGEKNM